MAAPKFKITVNGVETVIQAKPRHVLRSMREDAAEEYKDLTPGESGYRLAWMAAGTELSFDDWIDSLDDLEPVKQEGDDDDDDAEDKGEHLNPTSVASPSSLSAEE